jgi:nitrogen regulatory protein PII
MDCCIRHRISFTSFSTRKVMNLILAIIQPAKLDAVKEALVKLGIQGMTVTGAKGFGRQKGRPLAFLGLLDMEGKPFTIDFIPKIRIEVVVNDDVVDQVVDTIVATAKTGTIGDGKLFVIPVSRAIRIRTGEENEAALNVDVPATLSNPLKK